jgi:hydrogenase maturation protease
MTDPISSKKKILLYGFGNTTRSDDRLGIDFITELEKYYTDSDSVQLKTSGQLNLEDAELIAGFDIVILIDASLEEIDSFTFSEMTSEEHPSFTTHTFSPSNLVKLAGELYGKTPLVYLLQIKGYEWDFSERLSPKAAENLQKAVKYVQQRVTDFQNQE